MQTGYGKHDGVLWNVQGTAFWKGSISWSPHDLTRIEKGRRRKRLAEELERSIQPERPTELMLCTHCHVEIDVAYNALCYQCYKKIGRMPKQAKRAVITEVISA